MNDIKIENVEKIDGPANLIRVNYKHNGSKFPNSQIIHEEKLHKRYTNGDLELINEVKNIFGNIKIYKIFDRRGPNGKFSGCNVLYSYDGQKIRESAGIYNYFKIHCHKGYFESLSHNLQKAIKEYAEEKIRE
jgi:hypothetical protein